MQKLRILDRLRRFFSFLHVVENGATGFKLQTLDVCLHSKMLSGKVLNMTKRKEVALFDPMTLLEFRVLVKFFFPDVVLYISYPVLKRKSQCASNDQNPVCHRPRIDRAACFSAPR